MGRINSKIGVIHKRIQWFSATERKFENYFKHFLIHLS